METRDRRVLEKIAEEIAYLESLLDGVTESEFASNETTQRAAAMTAINIGELAKRLSAGFHEAFPGNELRYAAKTRDVYAHGYFSLSFATVFRTATEDYPRLREWILGVLGRG